MSKIDFNEDVIYKLLKFKAKGGAQSKFFQ